MSQPIDISPGVPGGASLCVSDLERSRRATRRTALAVFLGVLGAWAWAVCSPPAPQTSSADATPSLVQHAASPPRRSLDLAAFDAPVWTVAVPPEPPSPPPAPVVEPPPPPLRLQLLGIIREADSQPGILKAALYDPDTDRIVVVRSGDRVGVRTVESILADRISFALRRQVQTLHLRSDTPLSPIPFTNGGRAP